MSGNHLVGFVLCLYIKTSVATSFENQGALFYIRLFLIHTEWSLQNPLDFLSWHWIYVSAYSFKLQYSQLPVYSHELFFALIPCILILSKFYLFTNWCTSKIKNYTLVQALRLCTGRTAHRGRRDIALLFLDHGTRRGGEGSTSRSGRSLPPGKDTVRIVQEAWWSPGPVWTGAENLAPTGIRFPDRPAHSQSLYRLCYPAHWWISELS